MAIRMRINKEVDSVCKVCGTPRKKCLEMFDISFIKDKAQITICDLCNEELFRKTLKATVGVQGKLKSKKDIAVIQRRNRFN